MIHQLGDIETAGVTVNKQNVVESTRMTPGCPLLRNSRKIVIPTVARRSIGSFNSESELLTSQRVAALEGTLQRVTFRSP